MGVLTINPQEGQEVEDLCVLISISIGSIDEDARISYDDDKDRVEITAVDSGYVIDELIAIGAVCPISNDYTVEL